MNKILEFLQGHSESEKISENLVDKSKLGKSFNDIKNNLAFSDFKNERIIKLKSKPEIRKGQIWSCKQQYYDAFGNDVVGNIPYLVIVVSVLEQFADETFLRVQPISPFTEFKASDEILVENNSVIGFPFIIETWNEQPILTDLLDEYIGKFDFEKIKIESAKLALSLVQKEFRKTEIRNTAYLRQSISSLIEFQESSLENKVFLNIGNSVIRLEKIEDKIDVIGLVAETEQTYLAAAKKGKLRDRQCYVLEKCIDGIEVIIKVIREKDKFIMSIKQPENVEMKDIKGKLLKQVANGLYNEVESGLYFIKISGIESEIRITLK